MAMTARGMRGIPRPMAVTEIPMPRIRKSMGATDF
jgi:hypothetical protein